MGFKGDLMMLKKRALKNLMLSLFAMVIVGFTKSEVAHANPNATISDFSLSRTTAYLEESEGGYVFLTGKTPATGQYEYVIDVYFNGEQINNYPFSGGRLEIQLPIWKREVGTGYYEIVLVEYNEEWSEAVSEKVLGRLNFEIKPQKVVAPTPEPTPPTSNGGSSSNTGSSNSGTSNDDSSSNDSDKEQQTEESVKDEVVSDEEAKDEVDKDEELIEGEDEEELSTKLWGKPTQQSSKSNLPMVIAVSTVGVTGLGVGGYIGYMTYIKKQPLKIKFKKEWFKFKKRK